MGDRIRWVIEENLRVSHGEFARRLGVKAPQLSRWVNRADAPPSEPYLRRIAETAGVSAAWLRYGIGDPAGAGPPEDSAAGGGDGGGEDRLTAEDLFRHFERVVRRMGGAGVAPEELQLRKLDVVEGLSRLYSAQGAIPSWVYDLKRRILGGEL